MQLKNKKQREYFLDNYTKWEIWKEIPELELKFYRYVLPNGTVIIATEYAHMSFVRFDGLRSFYEKSMLVKYHLLLSKNDGYEDEYYKNAYKLYNPAGDSKSDIVKYLTKTSPEIEEEVLL